MEGKGGLWNYYYISKNVTLVQLIYIVVNLNHAVSIVGKWIFNSKYKIHFH